MVCGLRSTMQNTGRGGSHSNNGKVKGRRNEEIDVNRRYGGTRDREGGKQ